MTSGGRTVPKIVTATPRNPASRYPSRIEALMVIEPGADWAIAVRFQHLVLVEPLFFPDEFATHQRHNDKPAPHRKRTQLKRGDKKIPVKPLIPDHNPSPLAAPPGRDIPSFPTGRRAKVRSVPRTTPFRIRKNRQRGKGTHSL